METVRNCDNCANFKTDKHGYWAPMCLDCGDDSSEKNPFPKWEPIFFKEPDGALPAFGDIAKFYDSRNELNRQVRQLLDKCPIHEEPLGEDIVNHPKHYTVHPSGVECIQITEHMNFCLGNAMKYIWRAGDKHETPLEDLRKAKWYIEREIARLENE